MKTTSKKQRAYKLGHTAEMLACVYLCCKGYRILARRLRNAMGEIDVIAYKNKCVVAVEVKARVRMEDCADAITTQKQQRVARALSLWVADYKIAGLAPGHTPNMRFDVIWIVPRKWPIHIKDAWR